VEELQLQEQLPALVSEQQEEAMTGIVTSWERLAGVALVNRVLDKRFGPLSEEVKGQIAEYPYAQLETLIEAQVDFVSLDDLKAWLVTNPPPPWVDPLGEDEAEEQGSI
jgi:Domain of unknown function (DUF4351)